MGRQLATVRHIVPDSAKIIAVARRPGAVASLAGVRRHTCYQPVPGDAGADPAVTSVWVLWTDRPAEVTLTWSDAAYLVDERPQWGQEEHGGVTRLSFLLAAPGLSRAEFGDHWRDTHATLARRHHPTLWRYVQNVVVDALTPDAPEVDGIAELSFHTVADLRERMYDNEDGRRIVGADVRAFIDLSRGWRVLCHDGMNTF